jgi:hypothetical protein
MLGVFMFHSTYRFDPISQRLLVGCNSSVVNVVDFHFDTSVTTPIDTLKQDSRMFAAAAPKITARLTQVRFHVSFISMLTLSMKLW